MPNRIMRDDLITSERYWSVSPEARNLFVSVVLSADDTGRCQGSNFYLRTRCMAGTVSAERIEKLLLECVDVDLLRVYQHEGARYIFVPRFRQRLRYENSKYPAPPHGISDLPEKKSDHGQPSDSPKADSGRLEVEVDVKNNNTSRASVDALPDGFAEFWEAYPRKKAKQAAEKAWRKLKPDARLQAEIRAGLERYRASVQRSDPQHIAHAASWLNGRRWEDEPDPPRKSLDPRGDQLAFGALA